MATKERGTAEGWREIDRWGNGVGWIAYPDEDLQRASHALAADGSDESSAGGRPRDGTDVWVIDPVDTPDLDDLLAEFGEVRGVAILLDRHKRDADVVADRHDVPVFLPEGMSGVTDDLAAPVERFGDALPGTDYRTVEVVNNRFWQEFALHDESTGTLVVPEAVGTNPFFRTGDEKLGVHPVLRPWPPRRSLGGLDPDRILVGHGEGVFEDAAAALERALSTARRTAPRLYARATRHVLPF